MRFSEREGVALVRSLNRKRVSGPIVQCPPGRPTAWLINTSRGGLIDHADLWSALQQNLIAGAALDVFDPEPPDLSQPLFRDERVIVTPHAAFLSQEALVELRTRAANQIAAVLSGKRPENIVNPEACS